MEDEGKVWPVTQPHLLQLNDTLTGPWLGWGGLRDLSWSLTGQALRGTKDEYVLYCTDLMEPEEVMSYCPVTFAQLL